MKLTARASASAIALTVTVACVPARTQWSATGASRLTTSAPAMTAEQLSNLPGLTAFDALRTIPAYYGTVNHAPRPRFTLILDGMHVSDLDYLNSICATDVYEIRIRPASEATFAFSGPEVVVTTLAGRKRSR